MEDGEAAEERRRKMVPERADAVWDQQQGRRASVVEAEALPHLVEPEIVLEPVTSRPVLGEVVVLVVV